MVGKIGDWLSGLAEEAAAFRLRHARPLVTLTYAQSLDGSLAGQGRQGLALSGRESMRLTHQLRAHHQAILVGIGTVLADDPQLNVRLISGPSPQPVVLDTQLRIPLTCRLLKRAENQPWLLAALDVPTERVQAVESCGARVIRVPYAEAGGLDLPEVLARLSQQGVASLMIEGGAQVITHVLAQRLFDYAVITVAPVWVGGLASVAQDMQRQGAFPTLQTLVYESYGKDLVIWGRAGEQGL